MTGLARVLVERARIVLLLTAAITLAAMSQMPRLAFNADVTSFLLEGSAAGRDLAALQEKYGAADPITVLLEREDGGTFTDRAGLALLASAQLFFFKSGHDLRERYARVEAAFGGATPLFGEFAFDRALPEEAQLEALRVPVSRARGAAGRPARPLRRRHRPSGVPGTVP